MMDFDSDMMDFPLLLAFIHAYNHSRVRRKVLKQALVAPNLSPWMHLLHNGHDDSFIEITGFDYEAFNSLTNYLFENDIMAERGRGNTWVLDKPSRVGLVLLYLNSKLFLKHFCLIFGITPSACQRCVNDMLDLVADRLATHPQARIRFPGPAEKAMYAAMVEQREPSVTDVIGFIDGCSIPVMCTSEPNEQNAYYNGYHCDTMINNVFFFAPTGKIDYACYNCPGSWHDSTVSLPLKATVLRKLGQYKICVDQGFPRGGELYDKFVGPLSFRQRQALDPTCKRNILIRNAKYVSLRQASEWGMRALQGSFGRLKARLTADRHRRHTVVKSILLLHNYRTDCMGINQIATVFNPHYQRVINIDGYDRIARYFPNIDE